MKEIKNLFVPYELAELAHKNGFNDQCLAGFLIGDEGQFGIAGINTNHEDLPYSSDEWLCAPTWNQLIDWFRDKHNLCIEISYDWVTDKEFDCVCIGIDGTFYADALTKGADYYSCLSETIKKSFALIH